MYAARRKPLCTMVSWIGLLTLLCTSNYVSSQGGTCYEDEIMNPVMKYAASSQEPAEISKDPSLCAIKCGADNYTYGGSWMDSLCMCSNTKPTKEVADGECNTMDQIRVFKTSVTISRWSPLTIIAPRTLLYTGESMAVSIAEKGELATSLTFEISFGDALDTKEIIQDVTQPITLQYSRDGPVRILVSALEGDTVVASGSLTLQIVSRYGDGDITFTCPDEVLQNENFTCDIITKGGSHLFGIVQFGYESLDSFTIPQPETDRLGFGSRRFTQQLTPCDSATLVISGIQARYQVKVQFVNFLITKIESFDILHLRVACTDPNKYYYTADQCAIEESPISCTPPETFHTSIQNCNGDSNVDCEKKLRQLKLGSITNVESYNYILVEKTTFTPTKVGWQVVELPQRWDMEPGDRIGMLLQSSDVIGCASPSKFETADLISSSVTSLNPDGTVTFGSLARSTTITQMSAWGALFRHTQIKGKINQVGQMPVTLNLKLFSVDDDPLILVQQVKVYEAFNDTKLTENIFTMNKEAVLVLQTHKGSADKYIWDFGDSSPTAETAVNTVKHTYTSEGNFTVRVNMTNSAGFLDVEDTVMIRAAMEFTGITAPDAEVGKPTSITLSLSGGTQVVCEWQIDGTDVCAGETQTCSHTYTDAGLHAINVTCSNHVTKITQLATQSVIAAIRDVKPLTTSFALGTNRRLIFTFAQGSNMTVSLQINNEDKKVEVDYDSRQIYSEPFDITTPTRVSYRLLVRNQLGGDVDLTGDATFDISVDQMVVTCEPKIVEKDSDVTLNIGFAQGTSVLVTVDWGDWTNNEYRGPSLQPWSWNQPITKQYGESGVYKIKVTTAGGQKELITELDLPVQDKLGEYSIEKSSDSAPLNGIFTIQLKRTSGGVAVLTDIIIDWGDQSRITSERFDEKKAYPHVYTSELSANIVIRLQSSAEEKTLGTSVVVAKAVENFGCQVNPNPVAVNDQSSFTIFMQSARTVELEITFESGLTPQVEQLNEAQTTVIDHTYTQTGQKEVRILAKHSTGNKECSLTVDVQRPIVNMNVGFSVDESSPGSVSVSMEYTGAPADYPTSPEYYIDWGDGSDVEQGTMDVSETTITRNHKMSRMQYYTAVANISNGVSKITNPQQLSVFSRILSVDLSVTVNATGQPGFGPEHDRFPLGIPLRLTLLADGRPDNIINSSITATYNSSGNQVEVGTVDSHVQVHTFTEQGLVLISGTGGNPQSLRPFQKSIILTSDLRGIELTLPNRTLRSNEEGELRVIFQAVSPQTCICVTKTDAIGSIVIPAENKQPKDCASCPNYRASYKRPVQNILTIPIRYNQAGNDLVTAKADDSYTQLESSLLLTISEEPCNVPKIIFQQSEIEDPNRPLDVDASRPITIEAKLTDSQCILGRPRTTNWTIELMDMDTLSVLNRLDLSDQPSMQTMTLVIPHNRLEPGFYSATIHLKTDTTEDPTPIVLRKTAYFYKRVPSLVVQFDEGNPISMTIGLDRPEVCLDPESHSYDPVIGNRELPQNINNWTWHCAEALEKLTDDIVTPKPKGYTYPVPRSGCFGDGPGRVNHTEGSLCFSSENFEPSKKYRMQVRGTTDDGRTSMAIMDLITLSGILPHVHVKCTIPSLCRTPPAGVAQNIAWAIAKTDDLYLTSMVSQVPSDAVVTYSWTMRSVYQTTLGPVLPRSIQAVFSDGYNTSTLRIKKHFLNCDESAIGCVICSQAQYAGNEGKQCLRFVYLKGPRGGECKYQAFNQTFACVNCTNYQSDWGALSYQFYVDNQPRKTVAATKSPNVCFRIPVTNGKVPLCVAVSDVYGNELRDCFTEVELPPPSKEQLLENVADLLTTGNNSLQTIALTGDLTTKASIVNTVAETVYQWGTLSDSEPSDTPKNQTAIDEQRNQRSEFLADAVQVVSTMVPISADTALLSTTAIKTVLQSGKAIDRQSQKLLASSIESMSQGLVDLVSAENSQKQRETVDQVLDSVLSLIEVMHSQIKDSVPKDIVHEKNKLHYDVDLETDGLTGDGDVWTELSLKNAAEDQTAVVASSSPTFGSILNSRMKLIGPMLLEDEPPLLTNTSNGVVGMLRMRGGNLTDFSMPSSARGSTIKIPDLCTTLASKNMSCDAPFTLQSVATESNVFGYLESQQKGINVVMDSETVTLSIYQDGTMVELEEIEEPFEILINKGPHFVTPNFTSLDNTTQRPQLPPARIAADDSEVYQSLLVSQIIIPDDNVGLTFQLLPENIKECPQYLVVVRLVRQPLLTRKNGGYDFWQVIPNNTMECYNATDDPEMEGYPYTFFLDNTQLNEARAKEFNSTDTSKLSPDEKKRLFIGYRQLNPNEINKYGPNSSPAIPYPYRDQINNTALSRIYLSSCVSTRTENPDKWSPEGCVVGRKTTARRTQCLCWHLSTFASGWLELPNTIDFDYVFANMDFTKNPTLYATEIAIFAIFLLLFIWARRKDLKDVEKLGVTPLAENNPKNEYLYEIIVSTGRRNGSGTDSKVCCVLSGEYGDTVPFVLRDPHRKVLQRGHVDRFLLACPQPLGNLIYCRLWHDNSGEGDRASWYCNYLGVVDLQTREKSHFIVGKWFAVEEDDGQVDRLIPVSSREEMLTFVHMFSTSVSRNLSEDHLWISVVARPATSRFTRVERVACCLLLLFLSMLTSCMFYRGEGAAKQPNLFTIGPFALSAQEVFVAVINNLITFVPLFLVTYMFRGSRLHTSHATKLREVVEDHLNEQIDVEKYPPITNMATIEQRAMQTARFYSGETENETKVKRRDRSCPWQMRIFAWIILILCLVTAAVFTTFYGVSFGEASCKKWLSSLFLSFFTSVLLVQPVKVMLLAIFISFACKQTDRVDDIEILADEDTLIEGLGRRYQLQMDEEYLHNEYLMRNFKPRKLKILPPDPQELERARKYRLKQRRANDILREIFFYLIFLILLLVVTVGFRDPNAFMLKRSLQKTFFPDEYDDIRTVNEFNDWVKSTLIPGLRAQRWYNMDPALFQRGFMRDRSDRIIGYGLMRQLRTKPNSCNVYGKMQTFVKNCQSGYDMFTQDEQSYGVGWVPFEGDARKNNSSPEFMYTRQKELDGIPYMGEVTWYSGGGYVHLLRGSEDAMLRKFIKLEEQHWIDYSTRAIIVQFTSFNPNINLFGIVTALVEKPGVGALIPSYRIETANLFGSAATEAGKLEMAFQIAFALAVFCYLIKEARSIYHHRCKYFKMFWSYVEWFIIIGSFAAIAAYAYMIIATKDAIAEFSRTHGNVFMNFQFLAYWNEALTYLTALICFASTLKLVRLFRFNQRIGLLGSVLRYAAKDMKYFVVVFLVMFMAFVLVFYLLYADTLEGFRSFLGSTETCMQIILGKFDFTSMYEREMVLGPLLFALFTLCVIFIMVSMFVAILDDSFHRVLEDLSLQSDDYEMTQFILSQLILWSGLSRTGWGKRMITSAQTPSEPVFMEDSERELNEKLNEVNRMMDEFLSYVQLNHLAESEK